MFFCFSSSTGADGSEGSNAGGGAGGGGSGIEAIGLMERRTLLTTMCGVISVNFDLSIFYISNRLALHHVFLIYFFFVFLFFKYLKEHTGRMCTRSLRCPQHTDSQRKSVRQIMLDNSVTESDGHLLPAISDKDKEMIDVDTWEEGDSLASLLTAQVILSI